MKSYKFESFKDFCEQVTKSLNYMKENNFHGYFFVDYSTQEVIKANGTSFLQFYLNIYKRLIVNAHDELNVSGDVRCYLFIGDKSFYINRPWKRKFCRENLGKNFDGYDFEFLDNIFQVVTKSNLKDWLEKFTIRDRKRKEQV